MSARNNNREITILESKGIQIKNHYYHLVLTSSRLIFDSASDNIHRSIPLTVIQAVEPGTDYSGDPVITVSALSAHGEIKQLILRFSPSDFPDPQQMRSRWYTEIGKRIQQPVRDFPDIFPKNASPAPAFCTTCGKKLAEGSVFCDGCGTKTLFPVQAVLPEQRDDDTKEWVMGPAVSTRETGLPRKEQSSVYTGDPGIGKKATVIASPPRQRWKKRSFFSGFPKKKSALIIGVCLAAVIIAAAVFFVVLPSVAPGFNLTFPGMNVSFPNLGAVGLPVSPEGNTGTNAENYGSAENPEETAMPVATPPRPALTFAPDDPGAVLATYPSLFNTGNGAGLRALLSENMKSHYPLSMLNTELAAARLKGYSIQKIQITDQTIEEDSAVLDADISWKAGGSSQTSSPKLFLVYEGNQWKLDSLIFRP